ncbi:MAG: SDR family oxidoreductase [Asticcacaulis sp.]
MSLQNKTVIVTGGARDIGRSVSLRLAQAGANVVINYNANEATAAETLAAAKAAGAQAIAVKADVTDPAAVDALVAATVEAFGPDIHGLVNVAGGMVARKTIDLMDLAFFEHVMRLNVSSTFLATKAVVPHMQSGAAIVNLSSLAGRDGGGPGASAYASSKAAVMAFTRGMAKELGPKGIRVNALCPGLIGTSFHDTFSTLEGRAKVVGGTPLRREGAPDDVADCVAYLLGEGSAFLTGVCLDVNGGLFFS